MDAHDFKNLENVFSLARTAMINNEQELLNIINFKAQLFEKLKAVFPEKIEEVPIGEFRKEE